MRLYESEREAIVACVCDILRPEGSILLKQSNVILLGLGIMVAGIGLFCLGMYILITVARKGAV